MRTNQERYFISNIIFPLQELVQLLLNHGDIPIYFDDQYSQPKEKIRNLCIQVLSIFEQPEFINFFGEGKGRDKRNEINKNDPAFHRILSHGIKAKHGAVNNKFYSDTELQLPLSVFYYGTEKKYDYKYTPIMKIGKEEFHFFNDIEHVVRSLISLYQLRIDAPRIPWTATLKYNVDGHLIKLSVLDIFSFYDEGMTSSSNIRTFKLIDNLWSPADLEVEIGWQLLVKQ